MRRLPLFEFEDQPWCPAPIREAVTGYLRLVARMTRQAAPVAGALAGLLERSGHARIVDLCSGSGGVAGQVADALADAGRPVDLVLTDLYPDADAFRATARRTRAHVEFVADPVDATRVPPHLSGLRTIFNAFHHLEPPEAGKVLADAADSGTPLAVVEFVERSPFTLFGILTSPLWMLVAMPFARPLRPWPLVFTYLVPVAPLVALWDGLASWLRVYSLDELRAMAAAASRPGYTWEAGHWRVGPMRVTYLLGCPE